MKEAKLQKLVYMESLDFQIQGQSVPNDIEAQVRENIKAYENMSDKQITTRIRNFEKELMVKKEEAVLNLLDRLIDGSI